MLLVARLVFLINDDQSQALERQEHRRARSKDDVIGIGRQLLLPYLHTLGIGIFGMIDAQAVAEDALQALHHLHRQGDFRQQV